MGAHAEEGTEEDEDIDSIDLVRHLTFLSPDEEEPDRGGCGIVGEEGRLYTEEPLLVYPLSSTASSSSSLQGRDCLSFT